MPIYLGNKKIKGENSLVRAFVGNGKVYDAYTYETRTVEQDVPVTTQTIDDPNVYKYVTQTTEGTPGKIKIIYKDTYKNGILIETEEVSREIVTEMVAKTIRNGTKRDCPVSFDVVEKSAGFNHTYTCKIYMFSCPEEWDGRYGNFYSSLDDTSAEFELTIRAGSSGYYSVDYMRPGENRKGFIRVN